jgi:hypothetical protein
MMAQFCGVFGADISLDDVLTICADVAAANLWFPTTRMH